MFILYANNEIIQIGYKVKKTILFPIRNTDVTHIWFLCSTNVSTVMEVTLGQSYNKTALLTHSLVQRQLILYPSFNFMPIMNNR